MTVNYEDAINHMRTNLHWSDTRILTALGDSSGVGPEFATEVLEFLCSGEATTVEQAVGIIFNRRKRRVERQFRINHRMRLSK